MGLTQLPQPDVVTERPPQLPNPPRDGDFKEVDDGFGDSKVYIYLAGEWVRIMKVESRGEGVYPILVFDGDITSRPLQHAALLKWYNRDDNFYGVKINEW